MHSLRHLENIIGTPASVCWGERGSSVEEEEKKERVGEGGRYPHSPLRHPWIEESCYYHSNNVSSSPRLTRNYEISREHY